MIIQIIIFLIIKGTTTQQDHPCVFPSSRPLQIGISSRLCIKLSYPTDDNSTNITYVYAYPVTVDKFTALQLINISQIIKTSQPVILKFQFQNNADEYQINLSGQEDLLYRNMVSIIIQISHGKFKSIFIQPQDSQNCQFPSVKWNNLCYNSGYLSDSNELIIYLSWIGTDIYDEHMTSHTHRLKKLQRYYSGDIYKAASVIEYPQQIVQEQIVQE